MKSEKKPADIVRERLNALRVALLMRFGEKGSKVIMISSAVLIGLVLVLLIVFLCFRIQSIEVKGNVTMFNEGEIIDAAEIEEGDGLFWKSTGAIKRNISKNLPVAIDVRVRKSIFGKVTIVLDLVEVEYFCKYGDLYYALDSDLNVLDSNKSKSKYSAYGAVFIKLPEIRKPVLGEKIVFYYTVEETDTNGELLYEVEKASKYDYISEFLRDFRNSGYHSEADGVVLEEKFDVRVIYAEKFNIRFGDIRELDVKFRVLYEILADGDLKYSDKATIDLSDPSRATARTDLTLDFSEFVD